MAFLGLRPRDKATVLAFRRIIMAKKWFSSQWGKMPLFFGVHNV